MSYSTVKLSADFQGHNYNYIFEKSDSAYQKSLIVLLPGLGDDCYVHAEILKKYLKSEGFDFFRLAYQDPLSSKSIGALITKTCQNYEYKKIFFCSYSIGGLLVNQILNDASFVYKSIVDHSFFIAPVFSKNLVKENVRFIVEHDNFFNLMSFVTNAQFRKNRTSDWQQVSKHILKQVREGVFIDGVDLPSSFIVFNEDKICEIVKLKELLKGSNVKNWSMTAFESTKKHGKLGHAPKSWNEIFSFIAGRILIQSQG